MKKILFITIIGFSFIAQSTEYKKYPEFTAELKDFKSGEVLGIESDPKQEASKKKNNAMNFLKSLDHSVFQLHKGCGAVFVSNTGYALTALHCFDDLPKGLKKPFIEDKPKSEQVNIMDSIRTSIKDMEGYSYESWFFNSDRFPDHKDLLPLKLVSFGKGYPRFLKKNWKHTDQDIIQNAELLKAGIDDYAIIKLNKMPKNYQCVKTASSMPTSGSLTWTSGYPVNMAHKQIYLTTKTLDDLIFKTSVFSKNITAFFRRAMREIKIAKNNSEAWYRFEANQHISPFYVAVGRVFNNYNQLTKKFIYPINNDSEKLFDLITDSNKYIVTTSFVKPGFSGGGMFNTNQELVGINSMSPSTPIFMENKLQPLISHVRIDYVKDQVIEKFGQEMHDEIFNCQ